MSQDLRDPFTYALSSNKAWAAYKSHQNPDFFPRLAAGQSPKILWIGCSDSRCPETTILGAQPGDVFVHRNIANTVAPSDLSLLAAIKYSVAVLKVDHVILCGHSACGGAVAALGDDLVDDGGILDTWLSTLKNIRAANQEELNGIKDAGARAVRFAEMNVAAGVKVLMANPVIQKAMNERGLQVHGTLFDIACGCLRDLGVGTAKPSKAGARKANGAAAAAPEEIIRGQHATLVFGTDGADMTVR